MQQAQNGDTVRVQYTAMLEDGRVLSESQDADGVAFTLGSGEVIAGLEKVVLGMIPGETRTAEVPPQDAFGIRDENRLVVVSTQQIPEGVDATPGVMLTLHHPDGNVEPAVVASVRDGSVLLDTNHPLAGRALTLEVTLLDIN